MATPRFNLRNASLYLTKLKNKYQKQQNEEENIYDKTFIDEEDELNSDPSIKKLSSKKINSLTEGQQSDHAPEYKQPQHSPLPQPTQTIEQQEKQTQQTEFCDLIVIKYLEETLAIYKGDLEILQHNRENLQQEIYFVGKKIGKLHQLAAQNVQMNLQIDVLNQNLKQIIVQYHQSKKKVFMKKIALTKLYQKHQQKLKEFLLFDQRTHSDTHFSLKPDYFTSSYINQYSAFLNFKRQQSTQISNSLKNPENYEKQKKSFVHKLFEGKEQIYIFDGQKLKPSQNRKFQQDLQQSEKMKEKQVILYDEFGYDDENIAKKSKDKGKKMTEAEKNLLLGDLKNFSKSFKIPK